MRGANEKLSVQNQILSAFPGSFIYGKEIRVPVGEVQIKITLTCAKDNVEPGGDTELPGAKATKVTITEGEEPIFEDVSKNIEPSQAELEAVSNIMASLGL